MEIVIVVTIVFFVLTLAGTWLARRSAYTWADNEKAMGTDGARPEGASFGVQGGSASTVPSRPAGPAGHSSPARAASRPNQVVITGFDAPKND